jgi:hypothetical protein
LRTKEGSGLHSVNITSIACADRPAKGITKSPASSEGARSLNPILPGGETGKVLPFSLSRMNA